MAKKIGRRPGGQPTRQEIVDAARETFAAKGFRGATIRSIADAAGVDSALIGHYFGSKERLFAETLLFPDGAAERVLAALAGDVSGLGERLTRAYLGLWEDPATRSQMVIVTRSSLADDDAMAQVRPAIVSVIDQTGATAIPGPRPEVRFSLAMSQLFGAACVRHLAQAPPLRGLTFDELVDRVAPAVQLHLTGG